LQGRAFHLLLQSVLPRPLATPENFDKSFAYDQSVNQQPDPDHKWDHTDDPDPAQYLRFTGLKIAAQDNALSDADD
jgi:hypothetical protein